jgi:apolipoprotein D and lipocalin family protein
MNKYFLLFLFSWFIFSCTSIPKGIEPVQDFDKARYLGKWYEIARLDHPFERGLEQISATYTLREDGGIDVLNKGFNIEEQEWTEANGKAYFVGDEQIGHLKVSFFGPFYASYVIAELDKEGYQWAMVTGPDTDYLWFLSRQPSIPAATIEKLKQKANEAGFNVDSLIYVTHTSDEQKAK